MHPAEISLRADIDDLDLYRIAPRVLEIKRDLKYAFWHGFVDEYIYKELLEKLDKRYCSLCEQPF